MVISPLNRRRWRLFKANRLAFYSLVIFAVLFFISLFADFIANDKPILIRYKGEFYTPILKVYSETDFGGDLKIEPKYKEPEIQCLIISGGSQNCWDNPETIVKAAANRGWIIWPLIPYSYDTANDIQGTAPSAPDGNHWLGTDDTARDVLSRVVHGFRISLFFAFIVSAVSTVIGIAAGAIQGYFGGKTDLIFQRFLEIWGAMPSLYIIIILFAIFGRSFWLLVFITILFGWPALVGVVRAEFLRTRNFDYIRAAKALGVSDTKIMFRHILPNAAVATLTLMPFIVTGSIGTLASLDFLGFGLPSSYPSLGELTLQAKQNLQAPWLGFTAFMTFALMLSFLVFIFQGIRDAFDPRKGG